LGAVVIGTSDNSQVGLVLGLLMGAIAVLTAGLLGHRKGSAADWVEEMAAAWQQAADEDETHPPR